MVDRDDDRIRETERNTTVIHTESDRGRGGGLLIALVLLILVAAVLYFIFGGNLDRAADEVGVNVNVEAPDVKVPDIDVPDVDMPEVNVNLPEVNVDTDTKEEAPKAE